jgi:predicted nuclease of restriction endonuclease-like (RecB) superfamily
MKYHQLVKAIDSASQQLLGRAAVVVNQSLVIRNWVVGAYIVEFEQNGEDRARYGERLVASLANDLHKRGLQGFSLSNLKSYRQLYKTYPQIGQTLSGFSGLRQIPEISQTLSGQLKISSSLVRKSPSVITPLSPKAVLHFSWSQILELIRLDDPLKRAFYENECLKGNWSVRQLQRQIGSLLFERTGLSKNKTAVIARARRQEPQETIEDLIRDPYVLEFTGLAELPQYTESDLETALLDHLQKFLLELGAGFLFEARQRRITVGNEHDYIDLVFYHRHLRCHVLLDLKTRPFRHGDVGQMNFYLNWWKQNVTRADEQPPVGILLCSDKDHTKVQFATAGMANKLFVSRYLTALPSAEQLQRFVETDRARVEATMEQPARAGAKPAAAKSKRKKAKPSRRR